MLSSLPESFTAARQWRIPKTSIIFYIFEDKSSLYVALNHKKSLMEWANLKIWGMNRWSACVLENWME
jgi:hypothetical protein